MTESEAVEIALGDFRCSRCQLGHGEHYDSKVGWIAVLGCWSIDDEPGAWCARCSPIEIHNPKYKPDQVTRWTHFTMPSYNSSESVMARRRNTGNPKIHTGMAEYSA